MFLNSKGFKRLATDPNMSGLDRNGVGDDGGFDAEHAVFAAEFHIVEQGSAFGAGVPDDGIGKPSGGDGGALMGLENLDDVRRGFINAVDFARDMQHVMFFQQTCFVQNSVAVVGTFEPFDGGVQNVFDGEIRVQSGSEAQRGIAGIGHAHRHFEFIADSRNMQLDLKNERPNR